MNHFDERDPAAEAHFELGNRLHLLEEKVKELASEIKTKMSDHYGDHYKNIDRVNARVNDLEGGLEKLDTDKRLQDLESDKVHRCLQCDKWKRGYWLNIGQGYTFCCGKCWYEFTSNRKRK